MILNCSKCNLLVISTIMILIYSKDVYADKNCLNELQQSGFIYNTGLKNYKINVLLMSEAEAEKLMLPYEEDAIISREKGEALQDYMTKKSDAIQQQKDRFHDPNQITVSQLYFSHLENHNEIPRLMRDPETFCSIADCPKTLNYTFFAYYGYFLHASTKSGTDLYMYKVYHAQLYNSGFIYNNAVLNYSRVAETEGYNKKMSGKYSTITLRYYEELTQKYRENKIDLLRAPISWTVIEICRDDLHLAGFKYGTAEENFKYGRISEGDPKHNQLKGYAKEYNKMLKEMAATFDNDREKTSEEQQQDELRKYSTMDMNWCGFIVCLEDLREAGFKNTVDENLKQIIPEMSQYDVDLSSEFVSHYYYYLKNYENTMKKNENIQDKIPLEDPMTLNEWCTKHTLYMVSPYYG